MNMTPENQEWENRLCAGLGTAPAPDFAAWSARHESDRAALTRPGVPTALRNGTRRALLMGLKVCAALVVVLAGMLWFSRDGHVGRSAFAGEIPGVDGVQSLTWTTTYSMRLTSEDGQRTWIQTERRLHAYQHPGLYRETLLNEKGEVIAVHVTDSQAGRMLALNLRERKAVLKRPTQRLTTRSPFAWVGEVIRDRKWGEYSRVTSLSLPGQKTVDKKPATIVRAILQDTQTQGRFQQDFLFDIETKRLVGVWAPSEIGFELERSADRDNPPETSRSKIMPIAAFDHEMVLNPPLDPALFSLDPPADFVLEKQVKPTVTEAEMLAWLRAAAEFGGGRLPDSPFVVFDSDKFNLASEKLDADRTPAEKALIELRDKFLMREIYRAPVQQFVDDHAVPNSFHYVGAGVRLGQSAQLVGWFQHSQSGQYRAFYGDLSVKDIASSDLPLQVGK